MIKPQSTTFFLVAAITISIAACDGKPVETTAPKTNVTGNETSKFSELKTFHKVLPTSMASLTVSDAKVTGLCFLDTLNDLPLSEKPTTLKAESKLSLVGWAVYNVNPATAGTAQAIQLIGENQSYYTLADSYNRTGLGAVLGNASLDSGGLIIKDVLLSVPADKYRVLFLTQSGNNLQRCDTGRVLKVE